MPSDHQGRRRPKNHRSAMADCHLKLRVVSNPAFGSLSRGDVRAAMSDIAFELLEGAIKNMERAHFGIDAIVHALVAQAPVLLPGRFLRLPGRSGSGCAPCGPNLTVSVQPFPVSLSGSESVRTAVTPYRRTFQALARSYTYSLSEFRKAAMEPYR
jgi:hypothetical protein